MNVNEAFDAFQKRVNASDDDIKEARRRRDLFKTAFGGRDDVDDVIASGSLRRGTHKHPIHDVDVIVVFKDGTHPEWGDSGESAADALDHVRGEVNNLLGATNGTVAKEVRLASPRNHAVKCFLDDPEVEGAFTVDAMPALRRDGMLLIPEKINEKWVPSDPEYLIEQVAKKHAEWNRFAGLVRMLKAWAVLQDTKIKSLVMEVLALDLLGDGPNRPAALKKFFVEAAYRVESLDPIVDPADVCGEIQRDLDMATLAERLHEAARLATQAISAVSNNDQAKAVGLWGAVFGEDFPKPPPPSSDGLTPALVAWPPSGDGKALPSPATVVMIPAALTFLMR